jgi:two-component system OmpR family sensor kinase
MRFRTQFSLRRRFILLLLLLLLVSYSAVALGTYIGLNRYLVSRLDQQLAAAGSRYAVELEHGDNDDDDGSGELGSVPGQATGTLGARIYGGAVTAVGLVGSQLSGESLTPDVRADLLAVAVDGQAVTVDLGSLGSYRIQAVAGRDGDVLVTGLPEHELHETMRTLLAVEATVLGVALVIAAAIAAPATRLALRPLNRLTEVADQVSSLPLESGEVALPLQIVAADSATEVGRLTHAFNSMLRNVESSLRSRYRSENQLRDFLADASHELRTPLAIVRGYSELALGPGQNDLSIVNDALARIHAESTRMGELVDDLLLLAHLDALPEPEFAPVDLTLIVIDVIAVARIAGRTHHWVLGLPEEPVVVEGNERQLRQLVLNLVTNARLHTPAETTVTVSLAPMPVDQPPGVVLVVADDGPGINSDDQSRIFDRFERSDVTHSGGHRGTGLGLAIVAAVTRAHRGTVALTSAPGRTEFTVTLPGDHRHVAHADVL